MSHSTASVVRRRDFLFIAAASFAPALLSAKLVENANVSYFAALRQQAELGPLAAHVQTLLRQESAASLQELTEWCASAGETIKSVVGDQWHTMTHTIPGLVDDDLLAGRTREALGLHFTATELAMLLSA